MGAVAFAALRWMLPSMLPPLLKSLAPTLQMFGWIALALFGIPGLISLARTKMKLAAGAASDVQAARGKAFCAARKSNSSEPPLPPWAASGSLGQYSPLESTPTPESQPKTRDNWTVEGLREREWKRFELLCAKYYEAVGFKSEAIHCGAAFVSNA
jgi:restriction system protein